MIPVWSGVSTLLRVITPLATRSILRNLSVCTGPLPSIGCPKEFTTRPSNASPTGTSTTRPVVLTISPSSILLALPNNTTPTLSSSRFSTMPYTSPGNCNSSPCMAFSSPCTRAIPSATWMTVPTSETSSWEEYLSICSLMTELISSGLKFMDLSHLSFSRSSQLNI